MWVSSHYRVTNDLSAEQVGQGPAVWHVLRHVETKSRRERGRIARMARCVSPISHDAAGRSGPGDAEHGPRADHGERHNRPGRASVTSSVNGPDSLVSCRTEAAANYEGFRRLLPDLLRDGSSPCLHFRAVAH
jgi:hypothetical protein